MLKILGFLTGSGEPTARYHQYRDKSQAKAVMGTALREAYPELFHINAKPTKSDRSAIEGRFKSELNVSDRTAELLAMTFYAFLELADLNATTTGVSIVKHTEDPADISDKKVGKSDDKAQHQSGQTILNLRHNIEVHLPATKDIEVYNAIFKSLKEHILD